MRPVKQKTAPTNPNTTTQLARKTAMRLHSFKLLMVFAAMLVLAACGDSQDGGSSSGADHDSLGYVGEVEGTEAFISVIVADSDTETDEAIVYICDGEAEIREWFRGPVGDPTSFELSNDAGAAVKVALVDGTMSGEFIDTAGLIHEFDTVEATGDAGLYIVDDEEATAEEIWAAWIVDNDGNERGAFLRSGSFSITPKLSSTNFRISQFLVLNAAIGTSADREASKPG